MTDAQAPVDDDAAPEWFIRVPAPEDLELVADSWRRSYDDAAGTGCPGGIAEYIRTQRAVIGQCLATSDVLVACNAARPAQVFGWVCYRRPAVLHYVFVKALYRKGGETFPAGGIARALVREALGEPKVLYVTHTWRRPRAVEERGAGAAIRAAYESARRAGVVVVYNPALVFGGDP